MTSVKAGGFYTCSAIMKKRLKRGECKLLHAKTKWQPANINTSLQTKLCEELGLHRTVARMLIQREITEMDEIRRFLNPQLTELYDPYLLDGMSEAVNRIKQALGEGEKILIYGDYDVDGVSSTSMMMLVLRELTTAVDYYIPNRFREGYGLNRQALEMAKEQGFSLVISVDTGISAVQEAAYARELGLDLIITDHHEPPSQLPDAIVINPKKMHCPYPFDQLAGVGVAFKLATALLERIPEEYLDLVALGTIADLVPLVGENRILATHGLKRMNTHLRVGIQALAEAAGIEQEITASHVGFALGPRINASGRLDSADLAVELLITDDTDKAEAIAQECNQLNQERQQMVQEITMAAMSQIEAEPKRFQHAIVVADVGWNAGVVGIVASRLVEKYYRPVIVLGIDPEKGIAKGSARSIAGFNLYQALSACEEHLIAYGGHQMAAGMTLEIEKVEILQKQLSHLAVETLQPEDWIPTSRVDDELTLDEIDIPFIQQLDELAPYGMGNPVPQFIIKGAQIGRKAVIGVHKDTLKLELRADEYRLDAIGFRMAEVATEMTSFATSDFLGELQINEWNGRQNPQLLIRDLKIAHPQVFDWRSNNRLKWEQIKRLDQEKTVFFAATSTRQLDGGVIIWQELGKYVQKPEPFAGKDYAVLLDPPPTMTAFRQMSDAFPHVERFYFLYGDTDWDHLLVKVPNREQFKLFYQTIHTKEQLSLSRHFPALQRKTGLSKRMLTFMIRVFQELEFIQIEQNQMKMLPNPSKKPLSASPYYQEQLEKEQVMQQFIYSSYQELCNYIFAEHGGQVHEFQGEHSGHPQLSQIRRTV